jgi:protein gp37
MPTKIEWTDETWNPVTGCVKLSPGCKNCYAQRFAERFRGVVHRSRRHAFYPGFDPTLRPERLEQPLRWRSPKRVFVNSMSDLFGDFVPDDFIERVFDTMRRTPLHSYQVLTKRADRMRRWTNGQRWLASANNIWLGVSVEDRRHGLPRIEQLRRSVAAVRFLSVEPLLEPLGAGLELDGVDWVIVGGESGPGARPMEAAWVREVRDACAAGSVPFFFKQWGGLRPKEQGRTLDGKVWSEYPRMN